MDKQPSIVTLAALIGRQGAVRVSNGLIVNVRVRDIKQSYGDTRYLVTPISGSGKVWVTSSTFTLDATEGV